MIRCNNCGWFNPDSAKHCEMCDEELTGLPIEKPSIEAEENELSAPEPEQKTALEPMPEQKPIQPEHNPIMATVQMGGTKAPHIPSFTQTVLDASDIMDSEESVECPKCRYPVYGYVDTCPNCGASLKRVMADKPQPQSGPSVTVKEDASTTAPLVTPESVIMKGTVLDVKSVKLPVAGLGSRGAKETIREIPNELISDQPELVNTWCLIPVESPDSETIYMQAGDIISIGNRRYLFKKQ